MDSNTKRYLTVGGLAVGAVAFVLLLSSASSAETTKPSPQPTPKPPTPPTPSQPPAPPTPPAPPSPPQPPAPPSATTSWRNATNADVAADRVQSRYTYFMNQPMGTEAIETHNGRTWKFVVCGGNNCTPPSQFLKDVRGFIGTSTV